MPREAEHYLTLLERFPAMIWRSRPPDGACDWFNATWLEFRGRALEQERGTGWFHDGVHPEDRERVMAGYLDAFADRRPFVLEYRLRRHDGAWRWIEDLARPFEEPDGSFGGFIGACYDVTDRREAVERLEDAQDAQTLLLQTAFHDIGSSLGAAITAVDTASRVPADQREPVLAAAGNQLRKMQRLLEGLRDLDRASHGRLHPRPVTVDLARLVTDVVDHADQRDRVRVDVEDRPVRLDPIMTERILENLVGNAVRHTPADAPVHVRARVRDGEVELVVRDEGPGIPPEQLPVLFDAYRQERDGSGRFGLGLSLVQRYVRAHGGRVTAHNQDPRGACFEVRLPELAEDGRTTDPPGTERKRTA